MRKANIKIAIFIAACVLAAAAIAGILFFDALRQDNTRVFTSFGSHITLYDDGTFSAQLPHNVRKSGTYTESMEEDGITTTVLFFYSGGTETGSIRSNFLSIPEAWEPICCGAGLRFRLMR
ncbi:MAG: hypothetical protein FWB91_01145 [Defluviitaleaceae bacterium]|nr:hypothetical protein [Defluviitaleaceae bacterium]